MTTIRHSLLRYFREHPQAKAWVLLSPAVVWLLLFTLVPIGVAIYYSLMTRGPWGAVVYELSFESYAAVLDPQFVRIFGRTLWLSLLTVLISLVAGYAVAYWIAMYGGRYKNLFLFLVIVPFWTSPLVRTYSWMFILSDNGLVNTYLKNMGLTDSSISFLFNQPIVLVGLVYAYIPFMILPLYASLERLDRSALEAATDLGATALQRFRKVTMPLTRGGMLAGSILVFSPTFGEFIIPELLGGANVMMLGKFIELKFFGLRDWPLGSAYALTVLTVVLILLYVYMKAGGGKEAFGEGR